MTTTTTSSATWQPTEDDIARAVTAVEEAEHCDSFEEDLVRAALATIGPIIERERAAAAVTVNIVFDGPPDHESGRFVEVETLDGHSVRIGEWMPYEGHDGWWSLRLATASTDAS